MAENRQMGVGGKTSPQTSPQTPPHPTPVGATRSTEEIERDIQARREGQNDPTMRPDLRSAQAQRPEDRQGHPGAHASGTAQTAAHGETPSARSREEKAISERQDSARRYESDDRDKTSAELEREVEYERHQLTRTLDQIRSRVSPGQIMDQAFQYARDAGGAEFGRNLGRSIRDNPLPVVLVGAGIGWLMMSGSSGGSTYRRHEPREGSPDYRERASGIGADISQRASHAADAASDLASSARDGVHRATDRASSAFHSASETGSAVIERARDTMHQTGDQARSAMHHASEYAHDTRIGLQRSFMRLAEEQPVALGAIGLALGAAIAAMLPPTRIENRIMGAASDTLKDQVKGSVERQYDHAREVVEETSKDISQEFKDRGLSARSVGDAAVEATRKVGDSAREIAEGAKSEVRQQTGEQKTGTQQTGAQEGAGGPGGSPGEGAKSGAEMKPGAGYPLGSHGGTGGSGS